VAHAAATRVGRTAAARRALTALGVRRGAGAVTVFGLRATVRAGTVVTQAGPTREPVALPRSAPAARRLSGRLARAGVEAIRTPAVLRATEPSWLFYADHGPSQAFEHPGRVVLVGARTGRVRVSRTLRWIPLIDGRLPAFFRTPAAHEGARYRVFDRPWRAPARPAATAASARAGSAQASDAAARRLAAALAADRSCALRVSDTLGDVHDYGRVDRTSAELGRVLERLSGLDPGFVSQRITAGAGLSPVAAAERLIAAGCRTLLLYAAGGGTRTGAAGIVVGVRPAGRTAVHWHALAAADVARLVRRHRDVAFHLVFDAPFAYGNGVACVLLRGAQAAGRARPVDCRATCCPSRRSRPTR
jgi:hypothetical protein